MKFALVGALMIACACSSTSESGMTTTNKANPCATPGATYLMSFARVSGDCAEPPDQISNINADGTIPGDPISCKEITQDGCTARDTGCTFTGNGCTSTVSTSITFAADGATMSGLESITVTCNDGSSCSGTLRVSGVRQ